MAKVFRLTGRDVRASLARSARARQGAVVTNREFFGEYGMEDEYRHRHAGGNVLALENSLPGSKRVVMKDGVLRTYTPGLYDYYRLDAENRASLVPQPSTGASKATFDPARKPTNFNFSPDARTATATAASSKHVPLQFPRTTGKYWVELLLLAGSSSEYNGMGMCNASSNVNTYIGQDTNSSGVTEEPTRGNWVYQYNAASSASPFAAQAANAGAVMCMYIDVPARKYFVGVAASATAVPGWIGSAGFVSGGGDPNNPAHPGFDFGFSGAAMPAYVDYYGGAARLRAPNEMTFTGYAPVGTTLGWDDAP